MFTKLNGNFQVEIYYRSSCSHVLQNRCFQKICHIHRKTPVLESLDNSYFTLASICSRQLIGIPMGSDPAIFMINLFLYHYESEWLLQTKQRDL